MNTNKTIILIVIFNAFLLFGGLVFNYKGTILLILLGEAIGLIVGAFLKHLEGK